MDTTPLQFEALLVEALKFGIPVSEFWDLTPRETIAALDAAAWRIRQEQMQMLSLAWHTAALTRARRLPPLAQMLNRVRNAAKRRDVPIEQRHEEFEELKAKLNQAKGRGNHAPTKVTDGG